LRKKRTISNKKNFPTFFDGQFYAWHTPKRSPYIA
jgi:hypothetical protein